MTDGPCPLWALHRYRRNGRASLSALASYVRRWLIDSSEDVSLCMQR